MWQFKEHWSWRQESNPQHPAYKTGALPLNYASILNVPTGADGRDRTCGLLGTNQTLSQLSYISKPQYFVICLIICETQRLYSLQKKDTPSPCLAKRCMGIRIESPPREPLYSEPCGKQPARLLETPWEGSRGILSGSIHRSTTPGHFPKETPGGIR